jgi:hypothetical protein
MKTVAGFPYFEVQFTKAGNVLGAAEVKRSPTRFRRAACRNCSSSLTAGTTT